MSANIFWLINHQVGGLVVSKQGLGRTKSLGSVFDSY